MHEVVTANSSPPSDDDDGGRQRKRGGRGKGGTASNFGKTSQKETVAFSNVNYVRLDSVLSFVLSIRWHQCAIGRKIYFLCGGSVQYADCDRNQ